MASTRFCPGTRSVAWWFRDVTAFVPIVAEPHADDMKLTFGRLAQYQYARSRGDRFGADFDVGAEFPIVGCAKPRIALLQSPPAPGEYRAGLYIPVSFHMLWDLRDPSLPIINNDYRFAFLMFKGIVGIHHTGVAPSQIEWRWRVYAHESTHLGDELTIAAQDSTLRGGPPFMRVNVSGMYTEPAVGVMWDDVKGGTLEVRSGVTILVSGGGYYGDSVTLTTRTAADSLTIAQVPVVPSSRNAEPYIQSEGRWGRVVTSIDISDRIVLDYNKAPGQLEKRQPSFNIIVGRQSLSHTYGDRDRADVFARFYYGVNPHGQFRSQRYFHLFGIGLHMRT